MRPRLCCVDRREHRMPYRVRSVILGVLSTVRAGVERRAVRAARCGSQCFVHWRDGRRGRGHGLDQDVVYLDNVDVTATLRADSLVGWPGATGSSSFRSRRSRLACGYGWPGVGACRRRCWMACRATRRIQGHLPRISAERPSRSSVDNLDVPPNRWEKKAAAKRAPSGWQGRSVTRTTTS